MRNCNGDWAKAMEKLIMQNEQQFFESMKKVIDADIADELDPIDALSPEERGAFSRDLARHLMAMDAQSGEETLGNTETPELSLERAAAIQLVRDSSKVQVGFDRDKNSLTSIPANDTVWLMAAATESHDFSVVYQSERGIYAVEIFRGASQEDVLAQRGYVLIKVNAEYRAAYEGRRLSVSTRSDAGERPLAEAIVEDGEMYAEISLADLDTKRRDPISINVV